MAEAARWVGVRAVVEGNAAATRPRAMELHRLGEEALFDGPNQAGLVPLRVQSPGFSRQDRLHLGKLELGSIVREHRGAVAQGMQDREPGPGRDHTQITQGKVGRDLAFVVLRPFEVHEFRHTLRRCQLLERWSLLAVAQQEHVNAPSAGRQRTRRPHEPIESLHGLQSADEDQGAVTFPHIESCTQRSQAVRRQRGLRTSLRLGVEGVVHDEHPALEALRHEQLPRPLRVQQEARRTAVEQAAEPPFRPRFRLE